MPSKHEDREYNDWVDSLGAEDSASASGIKSEHISKHRVLVDHHRAALPHEELENDDIISLAASEGGSKGDRYD